MGSYLGGFCRPVGNGNCTSRERCRGQKRARVRQIGLDLNLPSAGSVALTNKSVAPHLDLDIVGGQH